MTGTEGIHEQVTGLGDDWLSITVRGPALLYVTQDGVTHWLDRQEPVPTNVEDDRMSERDRNILAALWRTFERRVMP